MSTHPNPCFAGYRYPAEVISTAVWLYFRFPLSLRMVEEMLAARGITVSYETVRQWGLKFGRNIANNLLRRAPRLRRSHRPVADYRIARGQAFETWAAVARLAA